jgi:hypothetical protein
MILEQIHIPFAPELASSVAITNQIAESNLATWVAEHWQWIVGGIIAFLFLTWVLGGFDKKPEPVAKEESKPETVTTPPNSNTLPFQTPKT